MTRTHNHHWAAARTLSDLGELVALWLEGHIDHYPGYHGPPDPETRPLVPVLARLNRAQFVTVGSQPAQPPTLGYDGRYWQQRAAVEGFAAEATLTRLRAAVTDTRLTLLAHHVLVPPWWRRWLPSWPWLTTHDDAIPVTASTDGRVHTTFGGRIPYSYLPLMWRGISTEAFRAVLTAFQVTIIDPHWARTDLLWDVLTERFLH